MKRCSNVSVTGGLFYFKVDANDNLNLVYAKSIKTDKNVSCLDQNGTIIVGLTQLT